jgi:hypothetical protein
MSRKSQVGNQNLREPIHRGGSADLEKEIDRLENLKASPVHDPGNSVIPPSNAPMPKEWKELSGQWGNA